MEFFKSLEGRVIARVEVIKEDFDEDDPRTGAIKMNRMCVIHFTDGSRFTVEAAGDDETDGHRWLNFEAEAGRAPTAKAGAKKK